MGCASSTPMIATAGSEMLKAASNVAADATKSAEDAVQDVTHTMGKTLDTAKETVGTAVTGIANDFGNAIKEQTGALDEAKNQLLEKLHLGNGEHKKPEALEGAVEVNNMTTTAMMTATKHAELDDIDIDERLSRGPTPAPDADSLKTSTPEPEIEQALANFNEESPPTPKPTLSELEQLKAEAKETIVNTTAAAVAVAATTTTAVAAVVTKGSTEKIHNDKDLTAETTNEPPVE